MKRKIKGRKEPPPQPEKAEELYPILSKKPLFNLSREASYMVFFIVWFLGFVIIFLRYYQ